MNNQSDLRRAGRTPSIRTPDQKLRVFVSSTIGELAAERAAAKNAISSLRLAPVLFEMGARPHPPQELYRAYLEQSDIFIGIYWQSYGWVAPDMTVSGIEDEYILSEGMPRLIYLKEPAANRDPQLKAMLARIKDGDSLSYQKFETPEQFAELLANDLALMLTERFTSSHLRQESGPFGEQRKYNLPLPRTSIIGRDQEISYLMSKLQNQSVRLVTLTGPGGAGKTRLSLEVAHSLKDKYKDGVWMISLASVKDPDLVASVVAGTFGVREAEHLPISQTILDWLGEKEMLLLMDNFEQILPAAKFVDQLLLRCPNITILATSRSPLRLRGENEYPVSPLSTRPFPNEQYSPAAQLFIERARDARPGLALTDQSTRAIAELTRRVDGLPLAIELAAARIRTLTPEALLIRMTQPLEMLNRGNRDLPTRQRNLRATIDWSYLLLEEPAQQLLRHLSVFSDGWTLEAAEDVCRSEGCKDVMETLEQLIDNSLVYLAKDGEEPRFGILATVQEFALKQLQLRGEEQAARAKHAEWVMHLCFGLSPYLRSGQRRVALTRMAQEAGNIRAALEWCTSEQGSLEIGTRIMAPYTLSCYFNSDLAECRRRAVEMLERVEAVQTSDEARALAYFSAGASEFLTVSSLKSVEWLKASAERLRVKDRFAVLTICLTLLGWTASSPEQYQQSQDFFDEALRIATETGDRWTEALIMAGRYGNIYTPDGTIDAPVVLGQMRQGIEIFHSIGDLWGEGFATINLGWMQLFLNQPEEGGASFERAVSIFEEEGYPVMLSWSRTGLAESRRELGDLAAARETHLLGLQSALESGSYLTASVSCRGLAIIAVANNNLPGCVELAAIGESISRQTLVRTMETMDKTMKMYLDSLGPEVNENVDRAIARMRTLSVHELARLAFVLAKR